MSERDYNAGDIVCMITEILFFIVIWLLNETLIVNLVPTMSHTKFLKWKPYLDMYNIYFHLW